MIRNIVYTPRKFDLSGLEGISDETLEMHFTLYEGYVQNTNTLNEQIRERVGKDGVDPSQSAAYAELTRRLGFEYNGMVLHEYYFENLRKGGGAGGPAAGSSFQKAAEESFGSFDVWKADFSAVGAMRGVGWAACYRDPITGGLSNHWIEMHETGHVSGFAPILIMDVWEHAWLLDFKPSERPAYIEAFLANVNWDVVNRRMDRATMARAA